MSLKMSKISDDEYEQQWLRQALKAQAMEQQDSAVDDDAEDEDEQPMVLTTEGDGSDSDRPQDIVYQNIQEIIPGLFIGDYTAAIDEALLREKGIQYIVAAMRQRYQVPEGITIKRVMIDDTSKTNILRHVNEVNAYIRQARSEGKKVLVHCQAGVSRSTTLCAAFLMSEFDLTADEAVDKIASVREVVCPAEFFMHQLELYERCNMDLDASKYPEYRRFLMNYNAQDMLDGDGVDELILAYYPTPAPSPRPRSPSAGDPFSLAMTPMNGSAPGTPGPRSRRGSSVSISSQEARSEIIARVRRGSAGANSLAASLGMSSINRRMSEGQHLGDFASLARRKSSRTKSTSERADEVKKIRALLEEKRKAEAEELGAKEAESANQSDNSKRPSVSTRISKSAQSGTKLRCKMCRRELAAREHVLEHEPGQGQKPFANKRIDMTQHRLETERRRLEKQQAAKEAEMRRNERQRIAAEAAEDILDEAEEAVASASESEDDLETPIAPKPAAQSYSQKTGIRPSEPKSSTGKSVAGAGQSARSLSSRLPPALAGLRVAMPLPLSHDFSATDGSAIADDEPTPSAEDNPLPLLPSTECSSYFTEPLSWMKPQLANGELNGKLICPNTRCQAKIGSFDWSGLQCSCHAWVCPGFALAVSKVDEVSF